MAKAAARKNSWKSACPGLVVVLSLVMTTALLCTPRVSPGAEPGVADLDAVEVMARAGADLELTLRYREGLNQVVGYCRGRSDLFPAAPVAPRILAPAARDEIVSAWKSLLDYTLALDSIAAFHDHFYLLTDRQAREQSLLAAYAALLFSYRQALDFIVLVEVDPALPVLLNEPVPALGLPAGSYDRYRLANLNVALAARFTALAATVRLTGVKPPATLAPILADDETAVLKYGGHEGPVLTMKNAMEVLRSAGFSLIFPVQAGISEWMGDTKVRRPHTSLISPRQVADLLPRLLPGDILLERREWYLSNIGLPGYWPHAALYVGTPDERRRAFGLPEVQNWVRRSGEESGDFERLLRRSYPEAYTQSGKPQEEEHLPRVLEAMSEGVVFTSAEHSAAADSLAVLRPRLTLQERAAAVLRAFRYAGRPYDFNFDFQTDATIVCTELIYKAYLSDGDTRGLKLPLSSILGRAVTPANEFCRVFDAEYGTPAQQFELLLFLDGNEANGNAVDAGLEAFRASWRRPKWHLLVQAGGSAPHP